MKNLHKIILFVAIFYLSTGSIFAQLSGNYTIGTTTDYDYNTFGEAINALSDIGINGNVTFTVANEIYPEQITLPYIDGSSYIINFISEGGSASIDYSGEFVAKIEGSHYHFENINFKNSSEYDEGATIRVVLFDTPSDALEDIVFTNCNFNGLTDLPATEENNDMFSIVYHNDANSISKIKFVNDTISGGSFGFNFHNFGSSNSEIIISRCEIKDYTSKGIWFNQIKYFTIEESLITNGVIDEGSTHPVEAINIDNAIDSFYIKSNVIILTSNTEKTGIKIANSSVSPTNNHISNNMISSIDGTSTLSTGIWLSSCSSLNTMFNSIYITDGNEHSSAYKLYDTDTPISSNNTLNNNLLINHSIGYSMILQDIGLLADFNNNDYYTDGPNLFKLDATNIETLEEWQFLDSETPVDLSSFSAFSETDFFISNTDLHIPEGSISYVENRAIAFFDVATTDIDGDLRDPDEDGFADVGADEGLFTLLWTGDVLDFVTWKDIVIIEDTVLVLEIEGASKSGNLSVAPGTILKFKSGAKLVGSGQIDAVGTEDAPILFTSEGTYWNGISYPSGSTSVSGFYQYCKFENSTQDNGGVFDIIGSLNDITIKNCKFYNNSSENGGAIYIDDSAPTIDANFFLNNVTTTGDGGAIYSTVQIPTLRNNIFYNNFAAQNGGAIFFSNVSGNPMIMNNTFHLNSALLGKSIYFANTNINVYNSILWDNSDDYQIYSDNSSNSITNCIIKGGYVSGTNITTYSEILGNNPLFTDINNLNFSVQANSVAVDGGDNTGQESELDYAGNERVYSYETVDMGAYELQAPRLYADAGENLESCDSEQYLPDTYYIYPYDFEWTVLNSDAYIIVNSSMMHVLTNIPPNTTVDVELSVTNGFITERDTVAFINTQPYAYAGEDELLINTDINNNDYPNVNLFANNPNTGETGVWEELSTGGLTISDISIYNPIVSDINYGQHLLKWTVFKDADPSCSNSDSLYIIAGHSFSSIPDGTFDWSNPSDWAEGAIPGIADSVTIFGVNGNINISGALCDRLYIGNGGTLNVFGDAKSESSLSCRTLTVEENSTKFKDIKGNANLYIQDFATLNIGSEYTTKSRSARGSGLYIGSGGTVFIRPNAEKGAKGIASLNIGSGGFIFIRPNAEKSAKAAGSLNIGSGGFVFIRPNAEKHRTSKSITDGGIYVGEGSSLIVEQTIAGTDGGYLELGKGRTIFLSPGSGKAAGGNFGLYGGTVFIRPNAEKSAKGLASSGIYCGRGGTIFIRPNAEKAGSNSTLTSPSLTIDGGKVVVGDNSKSKAITGSLRFNQIFIRPNAEKDIATDTSLIIYPSGELFRADEYFNQAEVIVYDGAAVSFLEGSSIDFQFMGYLNLKEGASLIDMNLSSDYDVQTNNSFKGDTKNLFSSCIENQDGASLGENKTFGKWDEPTASWVPYIDGDMLEAGVGYFLTYNWSDTYKSFYGKTRTGDISVPLTLTDVGNFEFEGWNLVGNPYPSSIDLEQIALASEIYNTFYSFDPNENCFKTYQQGGVSLNDANQYISQNNAFFVKTDANSSFDFGNDIRVHFASAAKNTKEISNILKLKVSGILFSDETAVLFNEDATNTLDKEYDAAKMLAQIGTGPTLYTKIIGEDTPIAINTFEYQTNTTRTIPLYFETNMEGSYTIDVTELIFEASTSVFLKDLKDNSMHDLRTNPSYNFDYLNSDDPNRFEIIFDGFVGIEDISTENNISIFSNKNTIFINNKFANSKVEVYDLNGKLLLQRNIFNIGINTVNVNLPQSIYLIKLITPEKTICEKVAISK